MYKINNFQYQTRQRYKFFQYLFHIRQKNKFHKKSLYSLKKRMFALIFLTTYYY